MKIIGMTILVLGLSVGARADECTDLARSFAEAPNNMRVGDLLQLQSCVSDRMQQKAQSADTSTADPAAGSPNLNLQVQPDKPSGDRPGASIPAPGLADH